MATISVGILGYELVAPSAEVMTISSGDNVGRHFIVVRLGEGATVIGPGHDRDQIVYARTLAAALTAAADEVEAALGESIEVTAP